MKIVCQLLDAQARDGQGFCLILPFRISILCVSVSRHPTTGFPPATLKAIAKMFNASEVKDKHTRFAIDSRVDSSCLEDSEVSKPSCDRFPFCYVCLLAGL